MKNTKTNLGLLTSGKRAKSISTTVVPFQAQIWGLFFFPGDNSVIILNLVLKEQKPSDTVKKWISLCPQYKLASCKSMKRKWKISVSANT